MAKDLVVVGLGSSAGGLEALQIMLSHLPEIDNCAYVIAQHLSPTHKSMMVDLLSRTTNIPVIEVKNAMPIRPKSIYMTPENTDIYVKNEKLYLKNIEQSFGPKPSVNYFFSSLANEFKHRAIGIILSGTGSDGSYGIRAIKAQGGMTIAQSPNTSKYDGMPLSAINTGKVDIVVPIDSLSKELERIVYALDSTGSLSVNERSLQQIYRLLFDEHGVDFSLYKRNTIIRRIERRLATLKTETLQKYLEELKKSKEEISNLYHDILIGVTSFFRDKESFESLKEYIELIISKKEQGEEIRFWSIGCSTGEEAYSIAIILSEVLKDKITKYKIKIFATDIDDESLKIARNGIYAETSLEGVDKQIIQRYFSVQKNQFEIKKSIRELVVFSRHNIISDAPFLRLDLITCRNLLIYFNQNLQNRFFPIVHYALKDNGYLFLGKSESVGQHLDLFSIIDKNSKIFKAQFIGIKEAPKLYNYSSSYKTYDEPKLKKYKNEEELLEEKVSEAVREVILNQCVVINSSNDIIYIKGEIPYLKFSEGRLSNNIFKLTGDDLSLDLRSTINKANKSRKIELTPFRLISIFENIMRYVRVIVVPLRDEKNDDWVNILFFQSEEAQNIKNHVTNSDDENELVEKLSLELNSTKTHLQNVIEELETSYEEMQSLNEELQSSNEELQSSNEELETTNEELQSTNEELQTAYSELRVLYDDKEKRAKQLEDLTEKLSKKSEDYRKQKELTEAIIDTATISITMLDNNGEITFANKQAEKLFGLKKKDIAGKKYNEQDWNISSFDGKSLNDEDLPFSIIKRTYEPVFDIKHVVEIEYNKIFLSISGAPLFDIQGSFKGAVFCIEDLTSNEILKNDIVYYENSIGNQKNYLGDERFDILELALFDINSDIRNYLNEISMINQTTKNKENSAKINNLITEISNNLDKKQEFYIDKIKYKRTPINKGILNMINLFSSIFNNNLINIEKDIDSLCDKKLETKIIDKVLFSIFEFILGVKLFYLEEDEMSLIIKGKNRKNGFELSYKFKNIDLNQFKEELKDRFNNTILNYFEQEKIKSSIKVDKSLELRFSF